MNTVHDICSSLLYTALLRDFQARKTLTLTRIWPSMLSLDSLKHTSSKHCSTHQQNTKLEFDIGVFFLKANRVQLHVLSWDIACCNVKRYPNIVLKMSWSCQSLCYWCFDFVVNYLMCFVFFVVSLLLNCAHGGEERLWLICWRFSSNKTIYQRACRHLRWRVAKKMLHFFETWLHTHVCTCVCTCIKVAM